jgi:V8-like Glu-specific endopeptidase
MDQTVRTELDEPTSNGDLLVDEAEEAPASGSDPGVVEPGDGELEVIGVGLPTLPAVAEADSTDALVPDLAGLPDVALASFTVVGTESVIGEDERRRISPASSFPWRVHCALRITARDGSRWIGTGFFIGSRVLVTAGHVVWINSASTARRGWVRRIEVMPGRDGADLPYGTVTSTRFNSVRGWTEQGDDEYDYGAIVLDTPLGERTGWLGFGAYTDGTLTSSTGNLSGYPGDRGSGTQQWYMARRISSVGVRKVFYDIDTFGGQSGSAVYRISGGHRYAVGIHAYGVGATPFNSATRINRPVFDNLRAWKAAHV